MYQEKTSDKIMIPQWEYKQLHEIAVRVNVVLEQMDADKYMSVDDVKRILAPHRAWETVDETDEALSYTE